MDARDTLHHCVKEGGSGAKRRNSELEPEGKADIPPAPLMYHSV